MKRLNHEIVNKSSLSRDSRQNPALRADTIDTPGYIQREREREEEGRLCRQRAKRFETGRGDAKENGERISLASFIWERVAVLRETRCPWTRRRR